MSSSTRDAITSFSQDLSDALDEIDRERQSAPVPSNLIKDPKQARECLPGSILLLNDDAVRHVPLTGGVQVSQTGEVKIKLAQLGSTQGSFHDAGALGQTVSRLVLGCLSDQGFEQEPGTRVKQGHVAAQGILVGGARARLVGCFDTTTASSIIKVGTAADDGTPKPTALLSVFEAIAQASLRWLPWNGLAQPPREDPASESQRARSIDGGKLETILAKTAWCKRYADEHSVSIADAEDTFDESAASSDRATRDLTIFSNHDSQFAVRSWKTVLQCLGFSSDDAAAYSYGVLATAAAGLAGRLGLTDALVRAFDADADFATGVVVALVSVILNIQDLDGHKWSSRR